MAELTVSLAEPLKEQASTADLAPLARLTKLTDFSLAGNQIDYLDLDPLAVLKKLQTLDLRSTGAAGSDLDDGNPHVVNGLTLTASANGGAVNATSLQLGVNVVGVGGDDSDQVEIDFGETGGNLFDIFKSLSKQDLLSIAELLLKKIKKNLTEKGIEFVISQELKEKIVELGYDPKFGAREMKRVIQDKIGNILAKALLANQLKRGDIIEVNIKDFSLDINPH